MPLESPLDYLPFSQTGHYRAGQVIYKQNEPPTSIYLVLEGRVKVSSFSNDGREVLLDVYQTDEFFGESAFLPLLAALIRPRLWRTPGS
jgi:CRP-like cAMP-binding protein